MWHPYRQFKRLSSGSTITVGLFLSGSRPVPNVRAEHGVLFVKYCSILLQALTIEADEDLLFSLYSLAQLENIWEEEREE